MRIGATVCFVIAAALVVVGVLGLLGVAVPQFGNPAGLFIAAGLLVLLAFWLFQQPRKDNQGPDETN